MKRSERPLRKSQLNLEAQQWEGLVALAEEGGAVPSWHIRRAIEIYLRMTEEERRAALAGCKPVVETGQSALSALEGTALQ